MIKNCTPHPIVVRINKTDLTFPSSGIIPRVRTVEKREEGIDHCDMEDPFCIFNQDLEGMDCGNCTVRFFIPCVSQTMGDVEGLPDPEEGTFLIVSQMVFAASDRADLVAPDTGKTCIRDSQGRILAVTQFLRKGGEVC
jgi:hypothetical protein